MVPGFISRWHLWLENSCTSSTVCSLAGRSCLGVSETSMSSGSYARRWPISAIGTPLDAQLCLASGPCLSNGQSKSRRYSRCMSIFRRASLVLVLALLLSSYSSEDELQKLNATRSACSSRNRTISCSYVLVSWHGYLVKVSFASSWGP